MKNSPFFFFLKKIMYICKKIESNYFLYIRIINMNKSINHFIKDTRIREFFRFGIVGTISMLIHLGIYYLLYIAIEKNIAYTIGYIISFLGNFIMTSYFTFEVKPTWKRLVKFGGSHFINYFVYIGLFNIFLHLGLSPKTAPLPVYLIAVPISFLLVRFSMTKKIGLKK